MTFRVPRSGIRSPDGPTSLGSLLNVSESSLIRNCLPNLSGATAKVAPLSTRSGSGSQSVAL